jgi:hypothetical protein
MRARFVATSCALVLAGCYQGLEQGVPGASAGPGGQASGGGDDTDGGADDGDGADDGPQSGDCEDGSVSVGTTPLRRLTRREYNATVRDLLGDDSAPADAFVADEKRGGFESNESAVDPLQVDQYRVAAMELAASAATRFDSLVPCDRAQTSCAEEFIADFGARTYRRPLDDEEQSAYVAMYEEIRDDASPDAALELVVQTMLISPYFLYHVEVGEPDSTRLTGHEVASRLSYFLWGTMPDDALFDAAAAGDLQARDAVEAQARRMLQDERAADMLASFSSQWLALGEVGDVVRDTTVFPDWDPALYAAMRTETETFIEQVVLHGDGRLDTLLTASYSYLDPDLAAHYGVVVGDDELGRTELPAERAGLLTQGALLVSHAYPTAASWVHRGKLVRERFLCGELPPPPPNVDFDDVNDPNRLERAECMGCHLLMDPIGVGFDRYDATGRYRTEDASGQAIPAGGEVYSHPIGEFESVTGLATALAESDDVRACVADQLGMYALGRELEEHDECSREAILTAFRESGFDLRELMVAIVTSDAFRHRAGE